MIRIYIFRFANNKSKYIFSNQAIFFLDEFVVGYIDKYNQLQGQISNSVVTHIGDINSYNQIKKFNT